jgi:MoxR-like ATPase
MEEGQVTVDGQSHALLKPFIVIATQNNVGTAGTQMLPYAQLDRFLVKLTIGYPNHENEIEIMRGRQTANPLDDIRQIVSVPDILRMQDEAAAVTVRDSVLDYIARISGQSRNCEALELGISPRGSLFVNKMAKARAYVKGRDYVIPGDVQDVLADVCAHRVILGQSARANRYSAHRVLASLLDEVRVPDGMGR